MLLRMTPKRWQRVHNSIAHLAMALIENEATVWFHDWTADKAWPPAEYPPPEIEERLTALQEHLGAAFKVGNGHSALSLVDAAIEDVKFLGTYPTKH